MKARKFLSLLLAILLCFSCFSIISFAEETDNEHITTVPDGYVGIYTKDDLFAVRENPSGKYILMNNIVFNDADYENGGDFYNSGKGWEPIGTSSTPFRGSFNGNKYAIVNLQINNPQENYQGLFGYTRNASIYAVNLRDANIVGCYSVGGIAGYFEANIASTSLYNCTCTGNITGSGNVGGIVGSSASSASSKESAYVYVKMCSNSAQIKGTEYVGGIVGHTSARYYGNSYGTYNEYSYVQNCVNSGDVICSNFSAGGIIGCANSTSNSGTGSYRPVTIKNCYNIGNISAKTNAGGIVGETNSYNEIMNSYSIGTIVAESNFGGCFGNTPKTMRFCYYLEDAVTDADCLTGIAKSTDQLRKKGTFEQWNFDTIWTMDGREDYPYPELRDVPLIFPDELNHEHEYSSEITTPATHLTEGVETFTCACGDTYTEAIAKTTEHTYSTIVTEPTCTDRGFTLYFCACNDFYMADYVEANGHSHSAEISTPATHLTEGLMTFTCACGDTYTEAIAKTTEHTYNAVVTAPTCTEKGYTTYTCECGDTYIADYVQENGHSYTSEITTPATHLTEGLMTFTCTCGDTYTEAIAKTTEHKYTFVVTAPTCAERGFTTYTCACGDSYIADYVDVIEHKDANSDKCCDYCNDFLGTEKDEKDCSHMCHSSGIWGIIWKILSLFYKLFGVSPVCECGAAHY